MVRDFGARRGRNPGPISVPDSGPENGTAGRQLIRIKTVDRKTVPFSGPESGFENGPGFRPQNFKYRGTVLQISWPCQRFAATPGSTPAAPSAWQRQKPETSTKLLQHPKMSQQMLADRPLHCRHPALCMQTCWRAPDKSCECVAGQGSSNAKAALHVTLLHLQFW